MRQVNLIILSWFGAGYIPKAPGTAGSLLAIPFAWLIASAWGETALIVAAAIVFLIGYVAITNTPEATDDPGWVVIDEVAGQWLTLAVVPPDPILYGIGFILFRGFDIYKPWPIGDIEKKVSGALGVMADDIAAAIYASAILYFIYTFLGI